MKRTLKRQPLHFPARVEAFLARTERHVRMIQSPTKMEFSFCALLYAWDALSCNDVHTQRWQKFWQTEAKNSTLAERCGEPVRQLTGAVAQKSYRRVRDGIKRVFQAVRERHGVVTEAGTSRVSPQAGFLAEMIEASYRSAKDLAPPEGYEMFLLKLVQLFEEALGVHDREAAAPALWRAEICRRRLGGNPETRTLADVDTAEERYRRHTSVPPGRVAEIVTCMLPPMRRIAARMRAMIEENGLPNGRARAEA